MRRERRFPSLHTYRGLSVSTVAMYRLGVLGKFIYLRLRLASRRDADLAGLRSLRGCGRGREALVVAGGPSASLLDPEKVAARQREGMQVFVVNMYCTSPMAEVVVPDYYVLADPEFFAMGSEMIDPQFTSPWRYIARHGVIPVIPAGSEVPIRTRRPVHFDNIGLQGWSGNILPTKARGYSSMVAYNALAVALFLDYSKVYVAGIDNDMFKRLYRDEDRLLRYSSGTHHHPADWTDHVVGQTAEGNMFRGGVAAYFENVGRVFGELALFRDDRVVHVDHNTLVDDFRVINSSDADILIERARNLPPNDFR